MYAAACLCLRDALYSVDAAFELQTAVCAYTVDPGLVNTDIGNKQTGSLVNLIWTLRKKHGVPPEVPAETYVFLCEQEAAPDGLYYYLCRKRKFSGEVTSENADRLFELSEKLCGTEYAGREAAG